MTIIEKINQLILKNFIVRILYKCKFYFDAGVTQITWFTGKLPEIMAFVYLAEKFGYKLSRTGLIIFAIIVATSIFLFGLFLKKTGLYDVERYVDAEKNPVTHEMLNAARKINKKWKN